MRQPWRCAWVMIVLSSAVTSTLGEVLPAVRFAPLAGSGGVPVADRRDDLVGGVLLDVVAGAVERDRAVVGEELLPALALGVPEGDVLGGPDDQRGTLA